MKYTALTIGPIVKSLSIAHKTRELWAASYIFSFFMENIIEEIKKEHKENIILPFPDKDKLIGKLEIKHIKKAGMFSDRLFLQSETGLFDELQDAVNKALEDVAGKLGLSDKRASNLKKYLTSYIVEDEYRERSFKNPKEKDNIIYQFNDFLANCELQTKYSNQDNDCFLRILEGINKTSLYEDIMGSSNTPFPSIIEIATSGLDIPTSVFKNDEEEDAEIWKAILEEEKKEKYKVDRKELTKEKCKLYGKLKVSHKYIAIVQADGDNVGKLIKQIYTEDSSRIFEFTRALSGFALKAAEKISKYGGLPVYAGGDDLLFFAPVTGKSNNIFGLISELDEVFKQSVINPFNNISLKQKPSMSYGVSISYYKYPLHEALTTARNLLFKEAKKGLKNAIVFKVLKHSGSCFETTLSKPFDANFEYLLGQKEELLLNSFMYNLDKHKTILESVIADTVKLKNYFDNFYNEDIHKSNEAKDFKKSVRILISETYKSNNSDFERTIHSVYSKLKLIKFLNSSNNE